MKNKQQLVDELVSHELFIQVLKDFEPLARARSEDPNVKAALKDNSELPALVLNPTHCYQIVIFEKLTRLYSVVDLIEQAIAYLQIEPTPKKLAKSGLYLSHWMQYHYTMYISAFTSALDCSMLLVAEAYDLGIAPKHCNMNLFKDHRRISGNDTWLALRAIEIEVQKEKQQRNTEHHRMERVSLGDVVNEPEFDLMSSVEFIHHMGGMGIGEFQLAQENIRRLGEKLCEHIQLRTRKLIALEIQLLDSLLPIYNARTGH